MALNCVEELPLGSLMVDKVILLSPCLEASYDLCKTINRTQKGIVAYRSALDVPISVPLTTLHGLANGQLHLSATVVGFQTPKHLSSREKEEYERLVVQKAFHPKMLKTGHVGGHFGWTMPAFVSKYVVPDLR